MSHPICDQSRQRSFLLIRLSLASFIVFFHSFPLGGFSRDILEVVTNGNMMGGIMSVRAFFTISGFLLTLSILKNPSIPRFSIRRFFRIMPGYWACITVTSFVVAPWLLSVFFGKPIPYLDSLALGKQSAIDYWTSNLLLKMGQTRIAPIFFGHPNPFFNGSLWTLFYEAVCYAFLVAIAAVGLVKSRVCAAITFSILFLVIPVNLIWPIPTGSESTFGHIFNYILHPRGSLFGLAFAGGILIARLWSHGAIFRPWVFLVALLSLTGSAPFEVGAFVWPIALPYILVCISEWPLLRRFEKMPDVSYGVYLYAFLIQQCLYMFSFAQYGFWPYFFMSLGISFLVGAMSWFLFEKPAVWLGERLIHRLQEAETDSGAIKVG